MTQATTTRTILFVIVVLLSAIGCAKPNTHKQTAAPTVAEMPAQTAPFIETSPGATTQPAAQTVAQPAAAPVIPADPGAAEQILASVVRIEFVGDGDAFLGSIGHATLVNGRYLVTHNHYGISPVALSSGTVAGAQGVTLYNAYGTVILEKAPMTMFTVVVEMAQMLVLDFGMVGEQLFAMQGLVSAPASDSLAMAAGMTVAQVNWDNSRAYIEWTTILDVTAFDGTLALVLDNGLLSGASGGGIFLNGVHVANNWTTVAERDAASGAVVREYSKAALNEAWSMASGQ